MIKDLDGEEWRAVEEFPRYQVSNCGRVKSCIGVEKLLKPYNVNGYLMVKFSIESNEQGKYLQKSFKIHRLVAKYFCEGFANDKQVHHLDRQRDNNFYLNLMCVTKAEHAAIHKQLNIEDKKKAAANDNVAAFCLIEKETDNNGSTESENNIH